MADDISIVLKTKLDTAEADKQLNEFKKQAELSEIKVKLTTESGKSNIQSEVQNAVKAAERVAQSNPIQIKIDTSKIGSAMADLPQKYINGIQKGLNEFESKFGSITAKLQSTSVEVDPFKNSAKATVQYADGVGKVTSVMMKLNAETGEYAGLSKKVVESQAKIDATIAKSNKQILGFETQYNKLHADAFEKNEQLTGDFAKPATDSLEAFKAKIEEVKASGNGMTDSAELELKQLQEAAKLAIDVQKSLQFGATDFAAKDVDPSKQVYALNADTQIARLQPLGSAADGMIQKFQELKKELENVTDMPGLNKWAEDFRVAQAEATKLKTEIQAIGKTEKTEQDIKRLGVVLENIRTHYASTLKQNPELSSSLDGLVNRLKSADAVSLKSIQGEVKTLQTQLKDASGESLTFSQALRDSFGSAGGYLASFLSATRIIQQSIQTIKSMVGEVRELDTALVDLQKVTGLSGNALDNFEKNAFSMGKQIGRTGTDVIDATATFSRAGYGLKEAEELSKAALILTNVSGIKDTAQAASDMTSILKAYGIAAEEAQSVVDKLYNVGNKQPIDVENITEGIVNAGGVLAQSGTTIEQSMALITGGFATLRNVSKVSTGLTTISQRLRAVGEDGEVIDGLMPKLEADFASFGSSVTDSDGNLRSTYELLGDLAEVWDTLSSKQQQKLGEDIAGKIGNFLPGAIVI